VVDASVLTAFYAAIRRVPLAPLLDRMWELRDNVIPYDADMSLSAAKRRQLPATASSVHSACTRR
jgi:hypothetical protein